MRPSDAQRVWTVAEAKARLSEILRLASETGPQMIGTKNAYVVIPAAEWLALTGDEPVRPSLGRWLIDNMPRGETEISLPDRQEPERAIPFDDDLEG